MLYNLNELCVKLQRKYDTILDLIEKSAREIWNFAHLPTKHDDDEEQTFAKELTDSCSTDYSKLGMFDK